MKWFHNYLWWFSLLWSLLVQSSAENNSGDKDDKDDKEYSELQNKLSAYTALLRRLEAEHPEDGDSRRSMANTACWKKSGICIERALCPDDNYERMIPGCNSDNRVCCFKWNTIAMRPDVIDKNPMSYASPYFYDMNKFSPYNPGMNVIKGKQNK